MSVAEQDLSSGWLNGGELGRLTRSFDWSRTPVGPMERWPATLRTTVSTLLACRQPMFLWWGPDLVQFYNDAYRPSLGNDRHPQALGARGREFWADIWDVIGPLVGQVRAGGPSVWAVDQRIPILRDGGFQEVYWTFSYSAVRDEAGAAAGVLVVCTETTEKVVGERRLRIFKDLAVEGLAATDGADAGRGAARVFAENSPDVPFAAIYLGRPQSQSLQRVGVHNLSDGCAPPLVSGGSDGAWPLWEAMRSGARQELTDVQQRAPGLCGPPWPEPVQSACVIPFFAAGDEAPRGVLLLGYSARLPVSAAYRDFFSLVATQVGSVVAHADSAARTRRALEREQAARENAEQEIVLRRRAEQAQADMLGEVERARAEAVAQRTRLENLFESAPALLCSVRGPNHIFERVNPLYQRLVGGARRLEGLPVAAALPELSGQGFVELLDQVFRTGEPYVGHEVRLTLDQSWTGAAQELFFTFVYQARRAPSGDVDGIDVFAFDVTPLVRARRDLELRAEFEQQLIGIVSHDLRTPLTSILLASKAMLRRSEDLDVRTTTSVVRIQASAERAVRLVRDLLDFTQARLGHGIPVLARATDLHELVRSTIDELRATYPEREFELKQAGGAEGFWDRDRLAQVLTNLVVNAVKYGRPEGPITLTSAGMEEGVTLEVHNFGEAISADKIAGLFQPLHRAPHAERDAERSVGLGLYIVDQIVRAHGGRVDVRSSEAEGTTFRVYLPRAGPGGQRPLV